MTQYLALIGCSQGDNPNLLKLYLFVRYSMSSLAIQLAIGQVRRADHALVTGSPAAS